MASLSASAWAGEPRADIGMSVAIPGAVRVAPNRVALRMPTTGSIPIERYADLMGLRLTNNADVPPIAQAGQVMNPGTSPSGAGIRPPGASVPPPPGIHTPLPPGFYYIPLEMLDHPNPEWLTAVSIRDEIELSSLSAAEKKELLLPWVWLSTRQAELSKKAKELDAAWNSARPSIEAGINTYIDGYWSVEAEGDVWRQDNAAYEAHCRRTVEPEELEAARRECEALHAGLYDRMLKIQAHGEAVDAEYERVVLSPLGEHLAEVDAYQATATHWSEKIRIFIAAGESAVRGCRPCSPYPAKTVGYIGPHDDHDHFPIGRPHLNLFVVNQNPKSCKCFWNKNTPDSVPPPPLPGWIDLNGGFPVLTP